MSASNLQQYMYIYKSMEEESYRNLNVHFEPGIGRLQWRVEGRQRSTLEDRRQVRSKVCSHATERQTEVHALSEQRVQTRSHSSLQTSFQDIQELRNLST